MFNYEDNNNHQGGKIVIDVCQFFSGNFHKFLTKRTQITQITQGIPICKKSFFMSFDMYVSNHFL